MTIASVNLICSHARNRLFSTCTECDEAENKIMREAGRKLGERTDARILAAIRAAVIDSIVSPGTCAHQTTVEHHTAARASFARCWACGATASPVHWPTADNPPTSTTDALNNFRQEFGHAD